MAPVISMAQCSTSRGAMPCLNSTIASRIASRPNVSAIARPKLNFPRGGGLHAARFQRQSLQCVAAAKAKFSSFQDMVDKSEVVLVDFYATWCGPCQMMSQIMEEAKKSIPNVSFTKVDTEKYPKIASQYQVQALPTLVLFKNGKEIGRMEGVLNASDLRRWVEQTLRSK